MELSSDRAGVLAAEAAGYARVALDNIGREYPTAVFQELNGPDDRLVRPRELTPVFYGSYDWHSCVEMHWLLVRLLRVGAGALPSAEIRQVLDAQFTQAGLAAEAADIVSGIAPGRRPYGWGWALTLAHELVTWDDPDGRRWAAAMSPLADAISDRFLGWLPKATYPVRYGVHPNSAFGLARALPYALERAKAGDAALADAIVAKALAWFGDDADYPGGYEPSGHDFLSPALAEAELMTQVLPAEEFASWLGRFLPGLASGQPAALFTPAVVSDASDGQIAHLHGLNASRAWCWRRLAEALPSGDARIGQALGAVRRHADVALPHVVGDNYAVEHWLAAYAVLLLS